MGERDTHTTLLAARRTPAYLHPISSNKYASSGATLCNAPTPSTASWTLEMMAVRAVRRHPRCSRHKAKGFIPTSLVVKQHVVASGRQDGSARAKRQVALPATSFQTLQRASPSEKEKKKLTWVRPASIGPSAHLSWDGPPVLHKPGAIGKGDRQGCGSGGSGGLISAHCRRGGRLVTAIPGGPGTRTSYLVHYSPR